MSKKGRNLSILPDGRLEATVCLREALRLAARGEGRTRPNPPVGAVLIRDGVIVGRGYHRRAGTNHAETAAIADATRHGRSVAGAKLYVTLEPCSKPGRVGACTDAIAAAGIARVYYAVPDPNPTNRGRAKRVLGRAGIPCACLRRLPEVRASATDDERRLAELVREAEILIAPFAKHVLTGLPYVTVKLAVSLDGRICDETGDAKWVSSAVSRKLTGWERARVDAILVGAETVRCDNPSLLSHNRRHDGLIRAVVTRSGNLPRTAQVFTDGRNPTIVFGDAKEALVELGRRGCLHVLCEGGLRLARSLAEEGLVDRWLQVTAPLVIGSRPIGDATRFRVRATRFSDPSVGDILTEYVR